MNYPAWSYIPAQRPAANMGGVVRRGRQACWGQDLDRRAQNWLEQR
jgi:hypothetical protein